LFIKNKLFILTSFFKQAASYGSKLINQSKLIVMKNQAAIFMTVCIVCFLFYCCTNATDTAVVTSDSASANNNMYAGYASQTEWGKHIATVTGCGDCHTPKKMTDRGPVDDSSLMFSGHPAQMPGPSLMPDQLAKGLAATNDLTAWIGPWGNSYAANITSDSTGIGSWSEEQFITCIRQGLYKGIAGSRPIMPPMPISSFRNMTDNELKALFSYLKTVKAVNNVVPEYRPPAGTPK